MNETGWKCLQCNTVWAPWVKYCEKCSGSSGITYIPIYPNVPWPPGTAVPWWQTWGPICQVVTSGGTQTVK